MKRHLWLAGLFAACALQAGGGQVSLTAQESWADVFGGREAVFHYTVTATGPWEGMFVWRVAYEGRTLARNERAVTVDAGQPATVEVRFEAPAVKAGVVLPVMLTVSAGAADTAAPAARSEKTLWVFPQDALADRQAWLKKLNIRLFDPEGKTTVLFEREKIPFTAMHNVAALAGVSEGMVMIGEGVSFKEYRGLASAMLQAAASGATVLCLAPGAGDLPLADADNAQAPRLESLVFRRNDIIRTLDKRLDARVWPPDGKLLASTLELKGERGPVIGQVLHTEAGWPWVDMTFTDGKRKGRLVVAGFALIEKWDAGPAPRYLLVKIWEHLAHNGAGSNVE